MLYRSNSSDPIYCFKQDVKKEVLKMCDLNDFFLYTTTTKGTLFNGNQLSKYVSNQKRPSCQGY